MLQPARVRSGPVVLGILLAGTAGLAQEPQSNPQQPQAAQEPKSRAQEPKPKPVVPPIRVPVDVEAEQRGQPVRDLTLEDALRLGRINNIELRAAELNPQQARQLIIEQEAAFVPELYGGVGYSETRSPTLNAFQPSLHSTQVDATLGWRQRVSTGGLFDLAYRPLRLDTSSSVPGVFPERQYGSEFIASYTQPLLRGAWTDVNLAGVDSARHLQAEAAQTFERTVQNTLLLIVTAYWELAYSRDNYSVVSAALVVAKEQLRITEERIRVRELAPRDRVADEAEVAFREEQLIVAEKDIRRREDVLRRFVFGDPQGLSWRTNLRPVSVIDISPEITPLDYEPFAEVARRERPDLKALRSDIAAQEVELTVANSNLLPALDLVGSYSSDGAREDFAGAWHNSIDQDFPDWALRLQFRLPIGNQGARAARERTLLELERRKRTYYGALMELELAVRDAVRSLESLAESIHASRVSVRLAESNLETEQVKLRVGTTTAFEVQRRNQALQEARSRHLRNQVDYRIAQGRLLHAQGILMAPPR
jgi:outer membrane protein TolC